MIRASKALYPWKDLNGDGFISPGRIKVDPAETDSVSAIRDDREYGRDYGVKRNNYPGLAGGKAPRGAANDLGTEIDAGIDWTLENNIVVSLKGGMFSPGTAAGYLINGTAKNLETVTQIRLGVRVPIREFSLGG